LDKGDKFQVLKSKLFILQNGVFMLLKQIVSISILSFTLINVQAADTDPVATVNGKTLTERDYRAYVEARKRQMNDPKLPSEQTLINEIINQELVVQDAIKRKLDETEEFKVKIQKIREGLLMQAALKLYWETHPLSEEELKKEYHKILSGIQLPKEYKSKHILVKTEEEAKALIIELEQGKDFGALAKEKSIDAVSAEKEGDLGWRNKQGFVLAFSAALESLKKGSYTTVPVETQFGWHIIQLDDVRDSEPPSFESVKENVEMKLQQTQQMHDYVEILRKEATIQILKETTPPADQAPTVPAPQPE